MNNCAPAQGAETPKHQDTRAPKWTGALVSGHVGTMTPTNERTNLMLPAELAAALDDLLPYAKHKKFIKRSDERNDLIRFILRIGAERMRADMQAETAPAASKPRKK
jgi:hypothetical protein